MKISWRASLLGSQLAELLRRPGRLMTTGLSVFVSAFVVFATVMAQQITMETTLDRFRGTPEAVSLVAAAGDESSTGISNATLKRIRAVPGVAEAAGRSDAGAPIAGPFERYLQLHADPGTGPLAQATLVKGDYPDGPGEIAVNRQAAEQLQLAPGTRVSLLVPDPKDEEGVATLKVAVRVTGVVRSTATSEQEAGGYLKDTYLARTAKVPDFTRVDIRAESGVTEGELSRRVRAVLGKAPSGGTVTSGSAVRAQEAKEAVSGDLREVFRLISLFLAVAVGAAALVTTSTFRIVFAQRLRQLALLRSIGAPQGRLVAALAVEGSLVGAVAGGLGVVMALGVGQCVPWGARLLAGQELSAPGFPLPQAVLVVLGTVLVTVCAVLSPALSAARVSPLQALRAAGTVTGERRISPVRLAVGLLLTAAATALTWQLLGDLPNSGQNDYDRGFAMVVTVAVAGFAFLALIALGPLLVRPVLAVLSWPLRLFGPTGRLAVSGVGGTPRRAASVSVVVALGVALVSGALVSLACLDGYMQRGAALTAPADFEVAAGEQGLDASVIRRFAASPHLTHVTTYRSLTTTIGPKAGRQEIQVTDVDLTALPTSAHIDTATGSLDDLGPGNAVVASGLADLLGVQAGDSFTLPSRRGGIRLTVAATLPGEGPLLSNVLVAPADLDRMGASRTANGILADASAGGLTARGEGQRALETTVREHVSKPDDVSVNVLATTRESNQSELEIMRTTSLGLVALTVLIAVVGVTVTTSLTAIERTGEFGLLRALGMRGGALRRIVTLEAGLYGVLGGVLGLALGVPCAWLLMRVVLTTAPLRLPAGQLLALVAGLAVLTAVAGLLPARRAARTSPMSALSSGQ
ncbi:FtsX-like permease family protein [Streptomyces aurantiacus]|uniref:ABC transporter substrate-binding protein n=1 Tax=Streptomyces aurantiacus TaxID=47760 RepID=A0A7G1NTB3_9ACTN|nr:FtsX-like permease family protein [Streptomyces aurantiacus]BCL26358.1 ABC transporter substrate-binding protein [Streptomyces aurantiacus]